MKLFVSILIVFVSLSAMPSFLAAEDAPAPKDWPEAMRTVRYPSPIDGSLQPAVVYVPESEDAVPLLVTLHSWGGDYAQKTPSRADWCIRHRWALIAPDFRGPNRTPEACGSEFVVADIVAAVDHMKNRTKIDEARIYLIGGSGGGYATLLLAGRHPEIWAAASAWCGITDLRDWHAETQAAKLHYARDIEKSCGGAPDADPEVDEQYRLRSSNTWMKNAGDVPLDINHGIHDGHTGSVPVTHAIKAFNLLASQDKRIGEEHMRYFRTQRQVPEDLRAETQADALYGSIPVLFRRISGKARLTIFDGGHSGSDAAALRWLSLQRKGQAPDWSVVEKPGSGRPASATEIQR